MSPAAMPNRDRGSLELELLKELADIGDSYHYY